MTVHVAKLYREPEEIFSAADRGETVTILHGSAEYILTLKQNNRPLYGCLPNSIRRDTGKPAADWKAAS